MLNDKYVVFKRQDAFQAPKDYEPETGDEHMLIPTHLALEDAIVIRRQDIFAGPGLFAYANAIQTAIDLGTQYPTLDPKPLEELRDFFWEQAMMAKDSPVKKVPD